MDVEPLAPGRRLDRDLLVLGKPAMGGTFMRFGPDVSRARATVNALRAEYRPICQATYEEYQTARSHLLALLPGEEVVISKAGKPVARLVPAAVAPQP